MVREQPPQALFLPFPQANCLRKRSQAKSKNNAWAQTETVRSKYLNGGFFCTLLSLQAFSLLYLIKSLERVLEIHSLV